MSRPAIQHRHKHELVARIDCAYAPSRNSVRFQAFGGDLAGSGARSLDNINGVSSEAALYCGRHDEREGDGWMFLCKSLIDEEGGAFGGCVDGTSRGGDDCGECRYEENRRGTRAELEQWNLIGKVSLNEDEIQRGSGVRRR